MFWRWPQSYVCCDRLSFLTDLISHSFSCTHCHSSVRRHSHWHQVRATVTVSPCSNRSVYEASGYSYTAPSPSHCIANHECESLPPQILISCRIPIVRRNKHNGDSVEPRSNCQRRLRQQQQQLNETALAAQVETRNQPVARPRYVSTVPTRLVTC